VFYSNFHGGIFTNNWKKAEFRDNVIKNNIFYKNTLKIENDNNSFLKSLNGRSIQFMFGIFGFVFENNDVFPLSSDNQWGIVAGSNGAFLNPANRQLTQWEKDYPDIFKNNMQADPKFVNPEKHDFHTKSGSVTIDKGAFLTKTIKQGSGTKIMVADAGYFSDGFGIDNEPGDVIQLANQTQTAKIVKVDYTNNSITVNKALAWSANQGVSLMYNASAPDIGCYEYGAQVYDTQVDIQNTHSSENKKVVAISIRSRNMKIVITLKTDRTSTARIKICDVAGKTIATRVSQLVQENTTIVWDRISDVGYFVPAGCYMLMLQCDDSVVFKQFVLCP
ncbi:MAG: hypothetical protein JW795_11890, partial [Chitinivibrionales bacterium]|nr:hypothetical protein [Chitinivibrionales bacterium]